MPFDFPETPTQDQEYTLGGITYIWDGEVWRTKAGPSFVMKAGDIMSGALELPAIFPTLTAQATHKGYVDQTIAAASLYQGPWFVALNVPDLIVESATALHTYSWTAQTADKDVPEICPPGVPGIAGQNIGAGDSVVWNANTSAYDLIQQPASTAGYVPLIGGTMTGPLQINTGIAQGLILADVAGVGGTLKLSASSGTHAGLVEFFDPNGTTRRGYVGYGDANNLVMVAEGTAKWTFNKSVTLSTSADGMGYYIGDTWHGMYFRGGNTLVFTEYHDRFEWRRQVSGAVGGGDLRMSLFGGTLTVPGEIVASGGMSFGSVAQTSATDLSRHIAVYGTTFGFSITSGTMNAVASSQLDFYTGTTLRARVSNGGISTFGAFTIDSGQNYSFYEDGNTNDLVFAMDGWSYVWTAQYVDYGVKFYKNVSAESLTDRGAAITKHDIRDVNEAEVMAAWAAVKPKRFRKNGDLDPTPVNANPTAKLRYGIVADDLLAAPAAKDIIRISDGEIDGTDLMQLLTLSIARIKLLEAEVAQLKGK